MKTGGRRHLRKHLDYKRWKKRLIEQGNRRYPISGVYEKEGRYLWYSYHNKHLKIVSRKAVRNYKGDISNGSYYKKIYDYRWQCY